MEEIKNIFFIFKMNCEVNDIPFSNEELSHPEPYLIAILISRFTLNEVLKCIYSLLYRYLLNIIYITYLWGTFIIAMYRALCSDLCKHYIFSIDMIMDTNRKQINDKKEKNHKYDKYYANNWRKKAFVSLTKNNVLYKYFFIDTLQLTFKNKTIFFITTPVPLNLKIYFSSFFFKFKRYLTLRKMIQMPLECGKCIIF